MRWMGLWLRIKVRLIGPRQGLGREEEVGDTGGMQMVGRRERLLENEC